MQPDHPSLAAGDPRWTLAAEVLVGRACSRIAYESDGEEYPEGAWEALEPHERAAVVEMLRPILVALADAGLLLPPDADPQPALIPVAPTGGETSEEWGIRVARADGTTYVDSGDEWWWTEDQARDELAANASAVGLERRTVHIGAWQAVPR